MKKLFAIALAFFAFSAMATGTYYQSPGGGVYFNNSNPAYGNPQPVYVQPRPVPYSNYGQNNQVYQQYQQQQPIQQYRTSPHQPREYYESNNDHRKYAECQARWSRSEFNSRYDSRARVCMVEVRRGMWVPENSIQITR